MGDNVIMPRALTAENGVKGAMNGEFFIEKIEECPECDNGVNMLDDGDLSVCELCDGKVEQRVRYRIPWTTIKEIYSKAVKHLGKEVN